MRTSFSLRFTCLLLCILLFSSLAGCKKEDAAWLPPTDNWCTFFDRMMAFNSYETDHAGYAAQIDDLRNASEQLKVFAETDKIIADHPYTKTFYLVIAQLPDVLDKAWENEQKMFFDLKGIFWYSMLRAWKYLLCIDHITDKHEYFDHLEFWAASWLHGYYNTGQTVRDMIPQDIPWDETAPFPGVT